MQNDFRSSERSSPGVEPLPDRWIVRQDLRRAARRGGPPRHALASMERGPSPIRQRGAVAAGALSDAAGVPADELRSGRLTPSPKPAIP